MGYRKKNISVAFYKGAPDLWVLDRLTGLLSEITRLPDGPLSTNTISPKHSPLLYYSFFFVELSHQEIAIGRKHGCPRPYSPSNNVQDYSVIFQTAFSHNTIYLLTPQLDCSSSTSHIGAQRLYFDSIILLHHLNA